MKILITASECSPLVKVGGIADVVGSLPITLLKQGVDARVAIPLYLPLQEKINSKEITTEKILDINIEFNGSLKPVEVYKTNLPGSSVTVYLIKNDELITNGGVYFSPRTMSSPDDEIYRFAFFSKAISSIFTYPDSIFLPDIIHCNDWHTGLIPQIIQSTHYFNSSGLPRTIFTIHNIGYQGFSKLDVADKLGLDISSDKSLTWDAQDDNLDFLLQGIIGSDYVTTVSGKYAKEIQTPEYGEGLQDILQTRKDRLIGILNGISYEVFNPKTDKNLAFPYSIADWNTEKVKNKLALQKELGLAENPNKPLIGIVSRLAFQKGLNHVAEALDELNKIGFQVVILGTGDPQLEVTLRNANTNPAYGRNYKACIEFSADLAMRIYAGSDMFLIPSRYEPCGLTQMIAMRYGAIPVVRGTGGLYDTVNDSENGFVYDAFSKDAMIEKLKKAYLLYSSDKKAWNTIVQKAMTADFSWNESSKKYIALYRKVMQLKDA